MPYMSAKCHTDIKKAEFTTSCNTLLHPDIQHRRVKMDLFWQAQMNSTVSAIDENSVRSSNNGRSTAPLKKTFTTTNITD